MNISNITSNTNIYELSKSSSTKNTSFNVQTSTDPVLDYYNTLCAQYPNVTFRLDDMETASNQSDVYLGYNNSMNQVGSNFGAVGQCSIRIDASVIRHMMSDARYENQVKDEINYTIDHYASYEDDTKACDMQYTSVCFEDTNGTFTPSIARSHMSYSTEEEVRAMWNNPDADQTKELLKHHVTQSTELFDHFMEMLDQSHEKQKELIKQSYSE